MPWDQGTISEAFLLRVNPAQKQWSKFRLPPVLYLAFKGAQISFVFCTVGIFDHVLVHAIGTPAACESHPIMPPQAVSILHADAHDDTSQGWTGIGPHIH